MTDREISARFRAIADILEIQGENVFKVRAYRVAADTIDDLEDSLADIHARGALKDLPGFGDAIVSKTADFLTSGTTAIWERIKDAVPEGVVRIAGIPGIGPKTAKTLWEALKVDSVEALETVCREGKLREVSGFGAAKEAQILEKIAAWRRLTEKTPRYIALPLAEKLAAELRKVPGVEAVEIGGDLRAGADEVREILLVVAGGFPTPLPTVGMPVRLIAPEDDSPEIVSPNLVTEADFKGQLHEHTTYSDGKNTIREMAEAALSRGYEYLAITDHSRSLRIANGLSRERLLAQLEEVQKLNEEFIPRGITLLTGIEADILQDGSLDGDDDILERLDIVVGSVHIRYRESSEQMTKRIVTALENPHLDILGHPTGRLLGRREPYPLDIDAVIAAAAKYKKVLEINASPERMDLKDEHAKKAKEAGVKLSVNCDAHSAAGLGNLEWGLCMARRAGLQAPDVINTRSLRDLRAALAA